MRLSERTRDRRVSNSRWDSKASNLRSPAYKPTSTITSMPPPYSTHHYWTKPPWLIAPHSLRGGRQGGSTTKMMTVNLDSLRQRRRPTFTRANTRGWLAAPSTSDGHCLSTLRLTTIEDQVKQGPGFLGERRPLLRARNIFCTRPYRSPFEGAVRKGCRGGDLGCGRPFPARWCSSWADMGLVYNSCVCLSFIRFCHLSVLFLRRFCDRQQKRGERRQYLSKSCLWEAW